ncbi:MAG: immunoglobulin domain-containing protein [Bacteroidetes bacterium]|nr:immunoglobulin domain-containing protein [Bacteroidota bacterium]
MKNFTQTFATLLCLVLAFENQAQTIFVAPGATGSGTSWADATGNLKAVLDNAASGTQIWVKEGTYLPTTCSNCNFLDRNQSFVIKSGAKLYGGFGGFETAIGQRNIAAHPTYLSGDIDEDGTLANNSYTVVYTHNVNVETLVDGFTITGGNADGAGAGLGTPQTSGGGWFNLGSTPGASSHPSIANCTFLGNYAWGYGAAMFNDGSFSGACNPVLTNCKFIGNSSRADGGAMYNTGSFNGQSSPVLTDCHFIENKSEQADGGAMFNMGQQGVSNPQLTNCTFLRDTAFYEGGAICNFGNNGISSPVLTDCIFEENVAEFGGAVYNDGTFGGYSGPEFLNCEFRANRSGNDGAAFYNSGYQGTCNPSVLGCLFEENHSGFGGGAIFSNGNEGISNPVVRNCRFLNNHADTYGGAMYNFGKGNLASQVPGNASPEITNCLFFNNMALSAGAVYNLGAELGNANAVITNCTFYGNHANIGGALYCNAGENGTGVASPIVENSIFWANTAIEGRVFRIIWGTPTIGNSLADVADCGELYNGNGGGVTCGGGMVFDQNPLFVSPASANFHLENGSPAIDFGSNPAINQTGIGIDLDSLPRIFNSTVDMGVYEFGSTLGSAPLVTQNPQNQQVCEGEEATFSISATGVQPLGFQWFKNGTAVSGASQNVLNLPATTLADAGTYTCTVSNTSGSTTSLPATLTVNEPATVSVAISASQTDICEAEEITLTAQPVNGGAAPTFQWFLNAVAFGSSVPSFNIGSLQDGDTFVCQVVSSENCVVNPTATSNLVTVNVENLLAAALGIAVGAEAVCEDQPVTITATPVNGGNSPSFFWTLDGNPVGADAPTLVVGAPQDGSEVQCSMVSSKNCVVENPVGSNVLTLDVLANVAASIAIAPSADSTICLGTEVVFTATLENGGTAPTFEWLLNGQPVGDNSPVFSSDALNDQDVVVCYLTSSDVCLLENPVLSNAVVVSVDSCAMASGWLTDETNSFFVSPNPSAGKIVVEISKPSNNFVLQILNTQGQIALTTHENHSVIPFKREFDLSGFPKGIYYLQIISDTQASVKKLVLH